ncbi:MAG: hypothetical protein U0360_08480 [Dehalococcoidia bacterium]
MNVTLRGGEYGVEVAVATLDGEALLETSAVDAALGALADEHAATSAPASSTITDVRTRPMGSHGDMKTPGYERVHPRR